MTKHFPTEQTMRRLDMALAVGLGFALGLATCALALVTIWGLT